MTNTYDSHTVLGLLRLFLHESSGADMIRVLALADQAGLKDAPSVVRQLCAEAASAGGTDSAVVKLAKPAPAPEPPAESEPEPEPDFKTDLAFTFSDYWGEKGLPEEFVKAMPADINLPAYMKSRVTPFVGVSPEEGRLLCSLLPPSLRLITAMTFAELRKESPGGVYRRCLVNRVRRDPESLGLFAGTVTPEDADRPTPGCGCERCYALRTPGVRLRGNIVQLVD